MAQKEKAEKIRTYVTTDGGNIYLIDTIEHEGALWLVPKWTDTPYPQMRKPARMIRMGRESVQNLGVAPKTRQQLYKLNGQVPKAALDGEADLRSQSDTQLFVVEAPDLMIRR
jgi:hypothetical protein